jgi:hypothetical protein
LWSRLRLDEHGEQEDVVPGEHSRALTREVAQGQAQPAQMGAPAHTQLRGELMPTGPEQTAHAPPLPVDRAGTPLAAASLEDMSWSRWQRSMMTAVAVVAAAVVATGHPADAPHSDGAAQRAVLTTGVATDGLPAAAANTRSLDRSPLATEPQAVPPSRALPRREAVRQVVQKAARSTQTPSGIRGPPA